MVLKCLVLAFFEGSMAVRLQETLAKKIFFFNETNNHSDSEHTELISFNA